MSSRKTSWEIILAGLALTTVALFLLSQTSSSSRSVSQAPAGAGVSTAETSPLSGTVVIDLERLEGLKNLGNLENLSDLENLRNLESLEQLEHLDIRIENLDALIAGASEEATVRSLDELKERLESINNAQYRVQLQNRKLFINKNYNVAEANWTEVSSGVFVYRQNLDIGDAELLDLSLAFGNLNIVGSEEAVGELSLQATGDISSAQVLSENLAFRHADNGATYELRVDGTEGTEIRNRVNLQATLTVPRRLAVRAFTSGGHINVSNLDGTSSFETSGGHVVLNSVSGNTSVRSSGGHIEGENISGNADLHTTGGHIRVAHSNGTMKIRTNGGHIDLQEVGGSIEASTSGGNITGSVTSADGPLSFTTSAGNLSLALPTDLQADIEAKGTQVTLPDVFSFEGTRTNSSLSGTINGGGIPLTLRCGYGNVIIRHE